MPLGKYQTFDRAPLVGQSSNARLQESNMRESLSYLLISELQFVRTASHI